MYKQLLEQIMRGLIVMMIIGILFLFVKLSFIYIYPFIIAFFIAGILNSPVSYLENHWKLSRSFATLTVISSIFLVFIGLLVLLITEIIQWTTYITDRLPEYFNSFINFSENIVEQHIIPFYQNMASYFRTLDPSHQTTIQENIKSFLENIASTGTEFIQSVLLQIPSVVSFFPGSLTILIFVLIASFVMTNDWYNITAMLKKFIPENILSYFYDFHIGIKKAFSGYLRAQLTIILISALLILIGLWIIGIKHAITIAIFAAIVALLPLIGTGVIFIPWIPYLFITANYSLTIHISILYVIVIIVRQLVEPKILSASIGVNPLVSLIVLFVTIQLWGIMGVILAPIILITLYVSYQSGILLKVIHFIRG